MLTSAKTKEISKAFPRASCIWVRGDLFLRKMERRLPQGETFRYIDIDSINNLKQAVREPKIIPTVSAPSRASRAVFAGSTLFSMVRPYLKNIAFMDEKMSDCIASTGFFVATPLPSLMDPKFLYYLLISNYCVNGLNFFIKGDNSPSINAEHITAFYFPFFPMAYQKRCVDVLDKVWNILDAIDKAQERIRTLSDRLRTRVLDSVFSSDKSYCRKIDEIGTVVGGGTPKTDEPKYWNGDVFWICPADMGRYREKFITKVSRKITQLGLEESGAVLMPKGSVIMSSRAPIGYLGIATTNISTSQGCKSVVPHDSRDSEYIYYALMSLVGKLKNIGKGTTFGEVSKKLLGNQTIYWPDERKREHIVSLLNVFFLITNHRLGVI